MKQSPFFRQAQLMLRALPSVARESCFALKGGTAINLFVQEMPRLGKVASPRGLARCARGCALRCAHPSALA
jgi:hypothetical protein